MIYRENNNDFNLIEYRKWKLVNLKYIYLMIMCSLNEKKNHLDNSKLI